jgi:hypothetical protein
MNESLVYYFRAFVPFLFLLLISLSLLLDQAPEPQRASVVVHRQARNLGEKPNFVREWLLTMYFAF